MTPDELADFEARSPQIGDDMDLGKYGMWKIAHMAGRTWTLARSDGTEIDIELQVN